MLSETCLLKSCEVEKDGRLYKGKTSLAEKKKKTKEGEFGKRNSSTARHEERDLEVLGGERAGR